MPYRYPLFHKAVHYLVIIATIVGLTLGIAQPQYTVKAASSLTVTPITWDVVGLDSNAPFSGPYNFPVGVRACNPASSTTSVNAVQADFTWTSSNSAITLRSGSLDPIIPNPTINLTPGQCTDFYFEVSLDRSASPYDQFRRYRIDVSGTDSGTSLPVTQSSPTPRQVYVERLVSQSRNSVSDVLLDGVSIPAGGSMNLLIGNSYQITLIGSTATNGYEQIESFINFPNTIFQVIGVATTYTAKPSPATDPLWASKLYADGCGWVNNPDSPAYRSCTGTGKYGGNIMVTYQVRIIGGAGSSEPLNTLIYDFSGSSYHYNADYNVAARVANIIDPTTVTISKAFTPDATVPGGVSRLTFTLHNPNGGLLSGLNFNDIFPTSPDAMVVANLPNASTSGCGTPTFSPVAGAGSISFSNGTIAANGYCSVSVNVTAPTIGTYSNTSGHLFVGTVDTGDSASGSLVIGSAPPAPTCTPGLELARWTMDPAQGTSVPPLFSFRSSRVSSATSSYSGTGTSAIDTAYGSPSVNSWKATGGWPASPPGSSASPYFEFVLDTTNFNTLNGITLNYNYMLRGNWANGANNHVYTYGSSNGGTSFANLGDIANPSKNAWHASPNYLLSPSSPTSTIFRINAVGQQQPTAALFLDTVVFTGCGVASPPTITKSFAPNPITVNSTSTLTFTLTNENNIPLTGVNFSDVLPAGLQVAATPAASTTCGGSPTWAPTAGGTNLTFGSPTGATIPARFGTTNGFCIVQVNVIATTPGPHDNVSGYISSNESGTNTGQGGSASATLTAILPPEIVKQFTPNPILAGGTSTLTFRITNPNPNDTLTGVGFTDTFPASPGAMTVAAPLTAVNGCGGSLLDNASGALAAGDLGVQLSGGSLVGGGSCTITVNVTAPVTGSYDNASGNVASTNGGAGNTAADTLEVSPPHPAISVLKQVSTGASGPWTSFLPVSVGSDIYYRFIVSNDGDVQLSSVNVNDPLVSTAGCVWHNGDGTLIAAPFDLPIASAANDQNYAVCVLGPIAATSGTHPNTATASGTYNAVTYTDTSTATYATTAVTLDKTAAETSFTAVGDLLHYSYLVTNSGASRLLGPVTITDDRATVSCPALDGIGNLDVFLDPGESVTCTATYTITDADIIARSVTNTASATVYGVTSNIDSVTVNMTFPDLTVTKTNNVLGTIPEYGIFNWTIVVSNSGLSLASFSSPQTILSDTLPGIAAYYPQGALAVTNGGTPPTGTINCSITGTALTCNAGDPVTFPIGASFSVTFPVTPTAVGNLANTAVVDPDTLVDESNEANNSSLDTVIVTDVLPDISATKTAVPVSIPETGGNVDFTYTSNKYQQRTCRDHRAQ